MLQRALGIGMASAMLLFGIPAGADALAQHQNVGGMDVYYGVMPYEVVRSNVMDQHGITPMHKKDWLARGVQHLVVSLYDAKTAQRITDAEVVATVTPLGSDPESKPLEHMSINQAVSYGNFFSMPKGDTPFKISIAIRRPGVHVPVQAEFEYRHPTKP